MKRVQIRLESVRIDELERTLDKCLAWFYANPRTKIGLNELTKNVRSSKTATKQIVEHLVRQKFLSRDVIGKAWLLSADQKHSFFVTKKIAHNLNMVYESGILAAVHKVIESPRAIILFGSYRWGTDVEESDIDIAVEVLGNKELEIVRLGIIEEMGFRKNVPVNLHVFSRNKIDLNLFANIANGIVLDGFLEVRT